MPYFYILFYLLLLQKNVDLLSIILYNQLYNFFLINL